MGRVAKRRCARGAACYQVRVLQLEEPPKLRATRQSDICQKCEEELAGGEEPLQEHKKLFRAARALLDNGIENEDEIIPTLVLAANVGQMPHLRRSSMPSKKPTRYILTPSSPKTSSTSRTSWASSSAPLAASLTPRVWRLACSSPAVPLISRHSNGMLLSAPS